MRDHALEAVKATECETATTKHEMDYYSRLFNADYRRLYLVTAHDSSFSPSIMKPHDLENLRDTLRLLR